MMTTNPHKPLLTLVMDDDWEALYVDGKLYEQDHSIDTSVLLRLLVDKGLIITSNQQGTAGLTHNQFPDKLEDVQYDPDWVEDY